MKNQPFNPIINDKSMLHTKVQKNTISSYKVDDFFDRWHTTELEAHASEMEAKRQQMCYDHRHTVNTLVWLKWKRTKTDADLWTGSIRTRSPGKAAILIFVDRKTNQNKPEMCAIRFRRALSSSKPSRKRIFQYSEKARFKVTTYEDALI